MRLEIMQQLPYVELLLALRPRGRSVVQEQLPLPLLLLRR
jgi:hypothetical protein